MLRQDFPVEMMLCVCDTRLQHHSQVAAHMLPVGDPAMLITVNFFMEMYLI